MNLTAGVIGCGYIARFHVPVLAKLGVRVKWLCDISRQAAESLLAETGAQYTDDYHRILEDPEVNLLDVLTLTHLHKSICLEAIAAGKNVICEKTLTTCADDSFEVVQAAQKANIVFYTAYMKRYIPAVVKAKELLPRLGRIVSTHVRTCQHWGRDLWRNHPSSGNLHTPPGGVSGLRENLGGGILPNGGSHILDLVCFLLGRPRSVYARMTYPEGRDYDLHVAALLQTDHGPVLMENMIHHLDHIGFLRDGWDERVEVTGLDGRLEIYSALWDKAQYKPSLLVHYDNTEKRSVEYHFPPVSPFDRELEAFCRQIASGVQGDPPKTAGYDVDEIIAHLYRSHEQNRPLEIRWRL